MYAYKDVLELAGLTTRIYSLLSALHNLPSLPTASPVDSVNPRISLDNVDVSIPASGARDAPLVKALSLSLCEGEHLMITGSNGVGKTAVARVLAGLWAPGNEGEGTIQRLGRGEVFVVPQRAYMVTGSLLEQYVWQVYLSPRLTDNVLKNNIPPHIPTVRAVGTDEGGPDGDPRGGTSGVLTHKRGRLDDAEGVERCVERR
jgi:ABC-type uncharacterized transport system fused permease/ATPase subunit